MNKRFVSFILTVAMVLSMVPMFGAVAFADGEPEVPHECDHNTWTAWGDETGQATTLPAIAGNYYLTTNVAITSTWNVPVSTAAVNLCLNGYVIKVSGAAVNVITVPSGATLNLYDCNKTNQTHYYNYSSTAAWTYIASPSATQIASAVVIEAITDNTEIVAISGGAITGGNATNGGGVYSSGVFNMYGGATCGNKATDQGGGVHVGGTFNMYGGAIRGNTVKNLGGGVHVAGTFNMQGGVIEYNSATTSATNYCWGGGGVVIFDNGKSTLSGGKIQYNSSTVNGGGVLILMTDGSSSQIITMAGVSITNNTAKQYGGGVFFDHVKDKVILGGNTIIRDNKLSDGTANNFQYSTGYQVQDGRSGTVTLGTGDNAPMGNFSVGVTPKTEKDGNMEITLGGEVQNLIGQFFLDNSIYAMTHEDGKLKFIKSWAQLKGALNGSITQTAIGLFEISGSAIKLLTDFKADTGDTTLTVSGIKTLDLNGHVIDANGINTVGSVITVPNDATLTFEDSSAESKAYKFTVLENGLWKYAGKWTDGDSESDTVKKVSGGCITGGTGTWSGSEYLGGGIYVGSVSNPNAKLVMSGGAIVGCSATKGGGVFTWGNMTMNNDSAIIGCTATIDGGGVCACNCSFTMNDNSNVSDCTASNGAGGVYIYGDEGVVANFTMNDNSEISDCKASANNSSKRRSGGGVCVEGNNCRFTMNGGKILNNEAEGSNGNGGGVNVFSGTFTMNSGSIASNTANYGGGIHVANGARVNITNGTIEDNCSEQSGGGAQVDGVLIMSGGAIQNNHAENDGGGLSVNGNTGNAKLTGTAKIISNTAINWGGGVSYYGSSNKVTLGGSVQIIGNKGKYTASGGTTQNVYLFGNNTIILGSEGNVPAEGMSVGITTEIPPTEGASVQITTNGTNDNAKYFFSDNSQYYIKVESNNLYLAKPSDDHYAINIMPSGNGTVTSSALESVSMASITLNVTPATGNKLKSLVVSDSSIEITSTSATTYVFTMPAVSVIVTAEFEPNVYKVSFDANGHGISPEAVNITYGSVVTQPENPSADGYTFDGWYEDAACTTEWAFTTTISGIITLYAKWTKIPTPPAPVYYGGDVTYYDVLTSAGANGTIDVDKKSASSGTTVTVTVTPEKGFALETLTVLDKNGKEIEVKDTQEKNKYTFRMPSSKVTVNATFMEDNTILNYCVDVKKERYYYEPVLWSYENEICKGTDELHFSPAKTLTRAEAVTMLWRIAGKPVVNYWMQFKDVESGRYYTEAVRWAASEKIAVGYSDEKFGTTDLITREQLATMIYGYVQKKGQGFTGSWMFLLPYEDRAKISDWANEAAHWCSMKGVINGKDGNLFDPQGTATRAEAITMLYRFDNLMK